MNIVLIMMLKFIINHIISTPIDLAKMAELIFRIL